VEGNLRETSLESVLELVHLTQQSGRISVDAEVPLAIELIQGEVVTGGILDWEGFDAIQSFALHEDAGTFKFLADATMIGQPRATLVGMPFQGFMTEWARINDEWARIRQWIDSPSRVLEYNGHGDSPFRNGKSIRAVARATGTSIFAIAQKAAVGVQSGELNPLDRYTWHGLRIQHKLSRKKLNPASRGQGDLPYFLDGQRNIVDILELGFKPETVRIYLSNAIRSGEVNMPGRGWLLRDLTWEFEKARTKTQAVAG
jgi:hypothetical protein